MTPEVSQHVGTLCVSFVPVSLAHLLPLPLLLAKYLAESELCDLRIRLLHCYFDGPPLLPEIATASVHSRGRTPLRSIAVSFARKTNASACWNVFVLPPVDSDGSRLETEADLHPMYPENCVYVRVLILTVGLLLLLPAVMTHFEILIRFVIYSLV